MNREDRRRANRESKRKKRQRAIREAQRNVERGSRPNAPLERRRATRRVNRSKPVMTFTGGSCSFPESFDGAGCCICGHARATECPCDAVDGLVHLERAHRRHDSDLMRETMGCPISESEPVAPAPHGHAHQGMFGAPCGDTLQYVTEINFPTMGYYRWHAIYDHLDSGACRSSRKCGEALASGEV